MGRATIAVLGMLVAGCSYNAEVLESPAYNVVTSYGNKVPGKWLLYVDAAPLQRPVKPAGYACSAHKFPINMAGPFATSAKQTISNLVEQVEVVNGPVDRGQVAAMGAVGLIVVRGEELRPRLEVQPGFWSANMAAQATVIASVSIDSAKHGRILGTTVEGQGTADAESGMACGGGAKALSAAAGMGMKDSMRKMGEAISNSERVRGAASSG